MKQILFTSDNIEFHEGFNDDDKINVFLHKNNKITSYQGINQLIDLENLNLSHNYLVGIGNLKGLINLKILDFSYNKLRTLDGLDGLNNLKILKLNENDLTVINIPLLKSLEELDLSNNMISKIKMDLPSLKKLELQNNMIEKINGLEQSCNLEFLDLENNALTTIKDLEQQSKLQYLNLKKNNIQYIHGKLKYLVDLRELYLSEKTRISLPLALMLCPKLSCINDNKYNEIICNKFDVNIIDYLYTLSENYQTEENDLVGRFLYHPLMKDETILYLLNFDSETLIHPEINMTNREILNVIATVTLDKKSNTKQIYANLNNMILYHKTTDDMIISLLTAVNGYINDNCRFLKHEKFGVENDEVEIYKQREKWLVARVRDLERNLILVTACSILIVTVDFWF